MIKIETRKLDLEINGVKCSLRYPTLDEIEKLDKKGEKVTYPEIKNLFKTLGMPEKVRKSLQLPQAVEIYQLILGVKKS